MIIAARQSFLTKTKPYDARVEYLQSSGTQYIDTGVFFDLNYNFSCNARVTILNSDRSVITGCFVGGITAPSFNLEFGGTSNNHARTPRGYIDRGNSSVDLWDGIFVLNTTHDLELTYTAGTTRTALLVVDGAQYSKTAPSGYYSPYAPQRIFKDWRVDSFSLSNSIRLHSITFKKNNVIVLDLIPVRKGQTGYLYDKISNQLFGNQGTGSFTFGPDK